MASTLIKLRVLVLLLACLASMKSAQADFSCEENASNCDNNQCDATNTTTVGPTTTNTGSTTTNTGSTTTTTAVATTTTTTTTAPAAGRRRLLADGCNSHTEKDACCADSCSWCENGATGPMVSVMSILVTVLVTVSMRM